MNYVCPSHLNTAINIVDIRSSKRLGPCIPMPIKVLFCLILITFLSCGAGSRESSSCPGKCLRVSRRAKFRCRRLFQSCELKMCTRTNEKGLEELGIMCIQKESVSNDTALLLPSRSPSSLGAAAGGLSPRPEMSDMPDIEYSPIILEEMESLEPENSLEFEEYEIYSTPEASVPPTVLKTLGSGQSLTENPQLSVSPIRSSTEKLNNRSSVEPTYSLDALTMRAILEKDVRKQEPDVFYEDSQNGKREEVISDSDHLESDDINEIGKKTSLQASPKLVRVGEPTVIKLSFKMEGKDQVDGLDCLRAYHLDSVTHNRSGLSTDLADDGTAIYFDDTPQDNIFTGIIALVSDIPNERIAFEVVPVIDGIENSLHPLSFKAGNVILSYGTRNPGADAIGGGLLRSPRMTVVDSLAGLQLKVHFIQFGEAEFVSSAMFLHDVVGAECEETGNSNELMHFTDEGNVQTVLIDLDAALEKGLLQDSITVQLRAGYKLVEDSTPVLLISVLENKRTKSELSGTRLSAALQMGMVEDGCSEADVAKISIFVGEKTAVVLKGTWMMKMTPA